MAEHPADIRAVAGSIPASPTRPRPQWRGAAMRACGLSGGRSPAGERGTGVREPDPLLSRAESGPTVRMPEPPAGSIPVGGRRRGFPAELLGGERGVRETDMGRYYEVHALETRACKVLGERPPFAWATVLALAAVCLVTLRFGDSLPVALASAIAVLVLALCPARRPWARTETAQQDEFIGHAVTARGATVLCERYRRIYDPDRVAPPQFWVVTPEGKSLTPGQLLLAADVDLPTPSLA